MTIKVVTTNRPPRLRFCLAVAALLPLTAGGCVYAYHEPGQGFQVGIAPPPRVEIDPELILPIAVGLGIIAGEIWGGHGGHCR